MNQSAPFPTFEDATPATQLRMATFRLARRLRSQRAIDRMSDGQFNVLAILHKEGSHTLSELAERERISAPSMNRTINGMEEFGWLERTPDENDRRKANISLTEQGHLLVLETVRRRDEWLDDALSELSSTERETLAAAATIMRKVADR